MKSITLARGQESLNFNLMKLTFNHLKDQYCKPLTALFQEESVTQKGEHHSFPWISNGKRGGCPTSTEYLSETGLNLREEKVKLKL